MDSGLIKVTSHRPIWPEWKWKKHETKRLLLYLGENIYGSDGTNYGKCEPSELLQYLVQRNSYAFVENILTGNILSNLSNWSDDNACSILSTQKGVPIAIRYEGYKKRTSWLVSLKTWFDKGYNDPFEALKIIEDTIDYLGVGSKPTPSSLGKETMRYIYEKYNISRKYCLPIGCEEYLLQNGFGGVMQSNYIGQTIPEVAQVDGAFKYVSLWDRHMDGTPLWCSGNWIENYATFFAKVMVRVRSDLPMGLFPVRTKDGSIIYPTRKGTYTTHLFKEKVLKLRDMGIECKVIEGWAWPDITTDNEEWKNWIFSKRINAPSKPTEGMVKKVAVSAIGSFLRSRDVFSVVGPQRYSPSTDYPILIGSNPIDLWVHTSRDDRSPIMGHWTLYTIDSANSDLIDLAYPFSIKDTMVMLDVDSAFIANNREWTEEINKDIVGFSKKGEVVPYPGQWLVTLHHNFKVLRHRMWVSDEEPDRYGSLLERIV